MVGAVPLGVREGLIEGSKCFISKRRDFEAFICVM